MNKITSFKTRAAATICGLAMSLFSAHAGMISDSLKGELVNYQNKELKPFDDSKLANVKVFALYYSAHWCGPCCAFTPQLVQFYNHVKKTHPEFELIFLSDDKTAEAMAEYMQVMKMPWPATEFGKGGTIRKYCGPGIPCLVVVDENGKVLADSFNGQKYLGAKSAMDELGKILKNNPETKPNTGSDFDALFKKKPAN